MYKKYGISLMLVLAGCSVFSRQAVRTKEDFSTMQQTFITSLDDAMARFVRNIDEIENKKQACITTVKKQIDAVLVMDPTMRTFENTVCPIDEASNTLGTVSEIFGMTRMLYEDAAMRDAAAKADVELKALYESLIAGNKAIYQALNEYLEQGCYEREQLTADQQYFIDESMIGFKRRGMHLPDEQLAQANELKNQIDELVKTFETNIDTDASSITATREQLVGMNDDLVNALKKNDAGLYILPCDYPTASEVMGYCSVSDTRKRFSEAFGNRAYPANVKVLEQIIAARDRFAKVLGFDSYAAYEISGEMAGSPQRVDQFLEQLINKATKKAQQEVAEIKQDLPDGIELDKQGRFNAWDYGYVHTQYKKKHFNLDQREVAEYFPVDKALQGMLDIYQKLLSLTFKIHKPAWAWHDEVQVLEVSSSKTGFLLGYIALDLYPRANKYNHACCGGLEFPVQNKEAASFGGRQPGLAIVVANFPRATSDKPALFKHADVETFFHEFGHAMHCLLGATRMHTQAGYQTKVDFVELPSQIFEEWLFDRDLLKSLSSHYQTGEPLPDHLIDALLNLKQFDSGEMVLGQVRNAYMSLHYFGPGEHKDTDAIRHKLGERLMPHLVPNYATHSQAAFGHLGGYGSRYYGYLWSKVFALDVFYQLRPKGLTNPATGDWFVAEILGNGGSIDPNDMLRSFLGREPKIDAFFDDLGLN